MSGETLVFVSWDSDHGETVALAFNSHVHTDDIAFEGVKLKYHTTPSSEPKGLFSPSHPMQQDPIKTAMATKFAFSRLYTGHAEYMYMKPYRHHKATVPAKK